MLSLTYSTSTNSEPSAVFGRCWWINCKQKEGREKRERKRGRRGKERKKRKEKKKKSWKGGKKEQKCIHFLWYFLVFGVKGSCGYLLQNFDPPLPGQKSNPISSRAKQLAHYLSVFTLTGTSIALGVPSTSMLLQNFVPPLYPCMYPMSQNYQTEYSVYNVYFQALVDSTWG